MHLDTKLPWKLLIIAAIFGEKDIILLSIYLSTLAISFMYSSKLKFLNKLNH